MPYAVDTFAVYQELIPQFGEAGARALTTVLSRIIGDLAQTVTKEEFRELKETVAELAEAQKRTEQRVEELVEAQKRTELRVEELVEAQKRTEQRVEELAEAQKRTEQEVRALARSLKQTRTMLGGLSDTVGYMLEDRAIQALPKLLPSLAGLAVEGPMQRRFVTDRHGELVEVNILGYARRQDGSQVTLVGEAKSRLRVRDFDSFQRLLLRLQGTEVIRGEALAVLVTYQVRPEVERRAAEAGILLVPSYQLPLF